MIYIRTKTFGQCFTFIKSKFPNFFIEVMNIFNKNTGPTKKKWRSAIILSLSSDPRSQSAIKKQWRLIARKHVLRLSQQDRDDRGRIARIAAGSFEMK